MRAAIADEFQTTPYLRAVGQARVHNGNFSHRELQHTSCSSMQLGNLEFILFNIFASGLRNQGRDLSQLKAPREGIKSVHQEQEKKKHIWCVGRGTTVA